MQTMNEIRRTDLHTILLTNNNTRRSRNKLFFNYILLLICLLFSFPLAGMADNPLDTINRRINPVEPLLRPLSNEIETKLQSLLDEYSPNSHIGLCVYDLTDDKMLYQYNGQSLFRPASTQKILTSITALNMLGNNYTFKTSIYYTGEIKDSVLCGDLYVVGGFDPAFDSNDMQALVNDICRYNIKRISGHVYYDVSMKDDTQVGEGWPRTSSRPVLDPLVFNRGRHFMPTFMEKLADQGVCVDSGYTARTCPKGLTIMTQCNHSIEQILFRMLKRSDNLYAEATFYQLAALIAESNATNKDAAKVINDQIRKIGMNPDNYKIVDGSGLSYDNAISPELEIAFLKYAYENPDIYKYFYASLPIAGVDGTLSRRMQNSTAYHNVRAKTGTLNGLSSLAGYATASNGHQLAFCIINQGFPRRLYAYEFQREICSALTMKPAEPTIPSLNNRLFIANNDSIHQPTTIQTDSIHPDIARK